MSDAYGTALWTLDFLFTNAVHGSGGVNLHGGGNGPGYTPIADAHSAVTALRPDYYGMLLFTLAGTGPLHPTMVEAGEIALSAYAVAATDGSLNVVLVNKDATTTAHVTVDSGAPASSATTTTLTGPSLGATAGYALGGAEVMADGTWAPAPPATLAVAGKMITVDVRPASATLLHIRQETCP